MNRAEAVKLISLEIIDFKQLERGQLLWKRETGMEFGVINSQPGTTHSQIFEAFQFGFGCDTSAEKAGVILILRQKERNIHFSHLKSADSNQTYSIKNDGIEEVFREVDRWMYIHELVELNVFASTMSFMFGNDLRCVLPENDHDLRHYLEKHLMKNPRVLNDYDEIDGNAQAVFEQKKLNDSTAKIVVDMKKGIESVAENRRQKSEAEVGRRDLKLLEAFGHSKHLESLSENANHMLRHMAGASNVQPEPVIDRLKNWDAKMDKYSARHQADEARKNCTSSVSKKLEKDIESLEAKIQSLKIFHRMPPSILLAKFRMSNLKIELDAARATLKQAEIEQQVSKISADWDADMRSYRNRKDNVEKMSGNDLIGIESIDASPMAKQEKRMKEEFAGMNSGENYDAEPYTFRIPSAKTQDEVRPYLDRLPMEGTFTVKTPDLKTHIFISKLLNSSSYSLKKRVIYIESCDPNDKGPYPKLPLPVEAKKVLSSKPTPMDSATGKLREMTEKLEKKEYIIGKKPENVDNSQFQRADEKLKQLSENVKRLEEKLAAQYRIDFGGLFQRIPTIDTSDTKVVLDWVETWTEYRHIARLKPNEFQAMVKDLETHLGETKKKLQRYNELTAQINDLKELQREGEEIVDDVDSVAVKHFGPSALSASTALTNTLREQIDCITVQLTEWGLKFNPTEEACAQAFYDRLAPQNKPAIESGDLSDIQSAVASKMDEIQKKLAVLQTKDNYTSCTAHTLIKIKKELMEQKRHTVNEIFELKSPLMSRSDAFKPQFSKLKECLHGLVEYCRPKWGVHLELFGEVSLDAPIRLMVDDQTLDRALTKAVTLNHGVAALILQLAINITIGSQFIIIDGSNGFIEPCLIDAIMLLLKQLVKKYDIQVILIKNNPQKQESGTRTYHTWTNEQNIVRIAETTDIVMGGDEEMGEPEELEQSRMSVASASSQSPSFLSGPPTGSSD